MKRITYAAWELLKVKNKTIAIKAYENNVKPDFVR